MKKSSKILSLALCLILLAGILAVPVAAAGVTTTQDKASAMKELGLFSGTDKGFELDRQPTRMEGLVMLIRLLGAEQEALSENNPHPFSDVPGWANAYAGYAYCCGLSTGVSQTAFGANNPMKAAEYVTLLLRALGYDDSNGDFVWNRSIEKAREIGMLSQEQAAQFANQPTTRGTLVELSWAALLQPLKDDSQTLAEVLIEGGVISQDLAVQYGLWTGPKKPYLVNTLAKASIPASGNSTYMMVLDRDENLIYYDAGKGEILSLVFQAGKTVSQTTLFDVKSAVYTANIDGSAVTYKDLQIEQLFYDDVAGRLIVTGCFQAVDDSVNDGWSDPDIPSSYQAAFTVESGKLVLFCESYPYFHSVMRDGRYLVSDYYYYDAQHRPEALVYIWDFDTDAKTEISLSSVRFMVQNGNDLYNMLPYSIYKYDLSTGSVEEFSTASREYTSCYGYNNGLFYYWSRGEICAYRPNGQKKVLLDTSVDIEVLDMTPLYRDEGRMLVTADEEIIFYDSSSKTVRIIYANPALANGADPEI